MPVIFEQKRTSTSIPRPLKQLVLDNNGVSHASKPSLDPIPITPAGKKLTKNQIILNQNRVEQKQDEDPVTPVLDLVPFSRQPIVNFGEVILGQTKVKSVAIRNSQDFQQQVYVRAFPKADKGFNIDATEFLLAPKTQIYVSLAWTPKVVSHVRESITFQDINRMPRRIVIIGSATRLKPEPTSRTSIPRFLRRAHPSRQSPNKSIRKQQPGKSNHIFTPIGRNSASKRFSPSKPLKRLIEQTRRRESGLIVKKILSQHNDSVATTVQSYWRMILAKRDLNRRRIERDAAIKIQSFWRVSKAKRDLRELRAKVAATKIQTFWRVSKARKTLGRLKMERDATIKIQSYFRMIIAKRILRDMKRAKAAAMTIQSFWRISRARVILNRLKSERDAAIRIQSFWRSITAKRELSRLRNIRLEKVLTLQSYFRMKLAQKQLHEMKKTQSCLIKTQTYCRMILAKRELRSLRRNHLAAIMIQSFWRVSLAKRALRSLKQERDAAVKIQSYWRMVLAYRELCRLRKREQCVIKIQSYCRMIIAKRDLKLTIQLQALCRGYMYRSQLRRSMESVLKIIGRSKLVV